MAGSPSLTSRAVALTEHLATRLRVDGHTVRQVRVRELPAEALIGGDASDPEIAEVIGELADATGVVVASGVYKATYSGVLKTLLDLLPQSVLAGKTVLPVLIGASLAHRLALDHGLRPVLTALGARHVTRGLFLLDKQIEQVSGAVRLVAEAPRQVLDAVDDFQAALPHFGMATR
ncbi:MAG: NADPH-dependent FMN reductase [Labedaea sp.]